MYKFLFVLFITFTAACQQKVGGPCEYREMEEVVGISEIEEKDEKISFITLSAGDASSVRSYRLSAEDIKPYLTRFDFKKLKEQQHSLIMKAEEITKGTCTPFVLVDLKPVN